MAADSDREIFLRLSALLTGYSATELEGTGLVTPFFEALPGIVTPGIVREILDSAGPLTPGADHDSIIQSLWQDPKLGPVVRNLVSLWYVGSWQPLPVNWQYRYTPNHPDPHASAYWPVPQQGFLEGLMWRTIHAHPPGARPGGFASWTEPPVTARPGVFAAGGGAK